MTTRLFTDVEGPTRTWLRAAGTPAGSRVWFGTPRGAVPTAPWITLFLVNDVPDMYGQTPITRALLQFDCWAAIRADAAALRAAVVTAVESIVPGTLLDHTLRCWTGRITRSQWFPDPANDMPRYSVDAELMVSATGA